MEKLTLNDPTTDASLVSKQKQEENDGNSSEPNSKKRAQRRPTRPSNVYAAPLSVPDTFSPPVFPKSEEETGFLAKALRSNFSF